MWDLTSHHRNGVLRATGVVATTLFLQSCTTAGDGRGAIEADKAEQLGDACAQMWAPFQSDNLATCEVRPATLRDSGQPDVISYLRRVDFRFDGDVGFLVNRLMLRTTPRTPGDPVRFGDMSPYTLQSVSGSVHVTAESVATLSSTVMFAHGPGEDSPLRGFSFSPDDGTFGMHAEMRRCGAWVPIESRGPPVLRDPQTTMLHSNMIKMRGQNAGTLMDAAYIELADLLSVPTPAVQLTGSEIVMQVPKLFPPLVLELKLSATRVMRDRLFVQIDDGSPQMPPLVHVADAQRPYILFRGSDTRSIRSMPMNARIGIAMIGPAKPFMFNLYRYRDQLIVGSLHFSPDDGIRVLVPPFGTLVVAKAAEATTIVKAGKPVLQFVKRTTS